MLKLGDRLQSVEMQVCRMKL